MNRRGGLYSGPTNQAHKAATALSLSLQLNLSIDGKRAGEQRAAFEGEEPSGFFKEPRKWARKPKRDRDGRQFANSEERARERASPSQALGERQLRWLPANRSSFLSLLLVLRILT